MASTNRTERRTGLNWWKFKQLRGVIAFKQEFKCAGCSNPLSPYNGESILHHKNGHPKDNNLFNLEVLCKVCHYDVHNWQTSEDRKLFQRKKKPTKKERIQSKIIPLEVV